MTKEIIYVPVSVEEKPVKDGWYVLVCDGGIDILRWFDLEYGWDIVEAESAYTHWLKPVPASEYATLQTSSLEAENKRLREELEQFKEGHTDLSNVRNRLHDEKQRLRDALEEIVDLIPESIGYDPGQFVYDLKSIAQSALSKPKH